MHTILQKSTALLPRYKAGDHFSQRNTCFATDKEILKVNQIYIPKLALQQPAKQQATQEIWICRFEL